MGEVRDLLRTALGEERSSPESFERTMMRARARRRNRRLGAGLVAIALFAAVGVGLSLALLLGGGSQPVSTPTPSAAIPSGTILYLLDPSLPPTITAVDVDTATGRSRTVSVPEIAGGDYPYYLVRRGNSLVFPGCPPGGPATCVIDEDLEGHPRSLGESWFFVPSAQPDRVWLAILDPNSPETVRALRAVREVTTAGRVTVPDVRPPDGQWPVAAVAEGLVLQPHGGGLEVWDPHTGEIVRRVGGPFPVATYGNLLAWTDQIQQILHITDVSTGNDVVVPLPPGAGAFDGYNGAFSPDGRTLAASVSIGSGFHGDRELVLVDVATGAAVPVEGSELPPPYNYIAWSSSGDDVFLSGGARGQERVLSYRPGDQQAHLLPITHASFTGMAAS